MIGRFSCLTLAVVIVPAGAKPPPPPSTPAAVTPATSGTATAAKKNYTDADVHFVAGMIGHHAQAIQMAGWSPSHGASQAVRGLSERIVVAQNDEIAFAQRWLREHGEVGPPADPRGPFMQGMGDPQLTPGIPKAAR